MKKISFDDLNGKVCVITGGAGVIGWSDGMDGTGLRGVSTRGELGYGVRKPEESSQ